MSDSYFPQLTSIIKWPFFLSHFDMFLNPTSCLQKILGPSVRPSVRPSVPPSFFPFIRPSVRTSVRLQTLTKIERDKIFFLIHVSLAADNGDFTGILNFQYQSGGQGKAFWMERAEGESGEIEEGGDFISWSRWTPERLATVERVGRIM